MFSEIFSRSAILFCVILFAFSVTDRRLIVVKNVQYCLVIFSECKAVSSPNNTYAVLVQEQKLASSKISLSPLKTCLKVFEKSSLGLHIISLYAAVFSTLNSVMNRAIKQCF